MAQAQHGSAPDIAGQGIANPGLADRFGRDAAGLARRPPRPARPRRAGARIGAALEAALADPRLRTPDLGGAGTTDDFAAAVGAAIESAPDTAR